MRWKNRAVQDSGERALLVRSLPVILMALLFTDQTALNPLIMVLVHVCGPPPFGSVMLKLQVQVHMSTPHPLLVPLGSENDKSEGESVHSELIILFVCSESAERPGKEVRHTIYRKIALFTRDQSRNPCPWDHLVHAYWIRHLRDG